MLLISFRWHGASPRWPLREEGVTCIRVVACCQLCLTPPSPSPDADGTKQEERADSDTDSYANTNRMT